MKQLSPKKQFMRTSQNLMLLGGMLLMAASCGTNSEPSDQSALARLTISGVPDQDGKVIKLDIAAHDFLKGQPEIHAVMGGAVLQSQYADSNGDGRKDQWLVELPAGPGKDNLLVEVRNGVLNEGMEKKTQAELWHKVTGKFKEGRYVGGGNFYRFDSLRVPDGFMDHAYFIKYEGPGWESDKVAYRLYLDWRNAVDVFGKRTSAMVLEPVGMDGYETYHHLDDWGMDILKVGKSLGIGTTAWWDGNRAVRVEKTDSVKCRILSDGTIQSQVQIWYDGWQLADEKVDMMSLKSIDAGSRMTVERLYFNQPVANICSGIRKDPKSHFIQLEGDSGEWACIATWGDQSLNNDNVGLAVLYPTSQEPVLEEDKLNYVVRFAKASDSIEYTFLAAWELEKEGISTEEAFKQYLMNELRMLENPYKIALTR